MQEIKIRDYLSENGIRPMTKRVKIMNYLVSRRNHPTADMIYLECVDIFDTHRIIHFSTDLFDRYGPEKALSSPKIGIGIEPKYTLEVI